MPGAEQGADMDTEDEADLTPLMEASRAVTWN